MAVPNDPQRQAIDPRAHAAVSASAGTGKTHVLTSRVFRLLLAGAAPESILCLTFTRAGAAEMAARIGDRLARWVRMPINELRGELEELGEIASKDRLREARTLFARVLDAPGGIRIQTIHSFAQSLLAAFPAEAGIAPGLRPLDGRAAEELAYATLAEMVSEAEARGDRQLITDIERLSARLGEQGAVKYLDKCAANSNALADLDLARAEAALRDAVGVHQCDLDAYLAEQCGDGAFDCALLRELAEANQRCGGIKASGYLDVITRWLDADVPTRVATLNDLLRVFRKADGDPRSPMKGQLAHDPGYEARGEQIAERIAALLDFQAGCRAVADMLGGLRAGKAFASAYARAKNAAGVADFNDLIAWTRRLLVQTDMADWVRFKLDQRIDHVLVDEAQDTNADQWSIISALVDEFFTGSSEVGGRWRTFLAVGDFKQAIFSFQGTDPEEFERVRALYRTRANTLSELHFESASEGDAPLPFNDVAMNQSYRSAQGVLDMVDEVIDVVGHTDMGLEERPGRHVSASKNRHLSATVDLWAPFFIEDAEDEETAGDGEEGWLDLRERRYATALADQVKSLLDSKAVLGSTGAPVRAKDILILVRSRRALAALIVARLAAAGVRVAGVDRLRLHEPLAVQDLLASLRFAVQPLDNLNLACLLVSPLVGWSQEDLLSVAAGRDNRSLWEVLRERAGEPGPAADAHPLLVELLNMADFVGPHEMLETILSGPLEGRRKLFGRLGTSARDPIEELLATAMTFEREESTSIERFLAWFRRGDLEVARDQAQLADEVRVMTVHGAKGLEAPVVIIADAQIDPDKQGQHDDPIWIEVDEVKVPLSRSGSKDLPMTFRKRLDKRKETDRKEHMRLLYVALTRAVERVVVAGLKPKRGGMPASSWYSKVEQALVGLDAEVVPGVLGWGDVLRFQRAGAASPPAAWGQELPVSVDEPEVVVPLWVRQPAPEESRPPRPLSPSAIGIDDEAAAPPSEAMRAAARRGTLIHSLLERLPEVPTDERMGRALDWLQRSGGVGDDGLRQGIADQVCGILANASYAPLFGAGSLGEAPLAATLTDGRVVAGTVDRLLVEDDRVSVIDFKTGRVPADEQAIPSGHRAQMSAYVAALKVIFPGRDVRASLLYTAGPTLFEVDA